MSRVYATRDQDGTLAFWSMMPERVPPMRGWPGRWKDQGGDSWEWSEKYGPDPLPEVSWNSEPVEIEITIRRR